jgi:hypothetical protein
VAPSKAMPLGEQTRDRGSQLESPIISEKYSRTFNTPAPLMTPERSLDEVLPVALHARSPGACLAVVHSHTRYRASIYVVRPQELKELKVAIHSATREARERPMTIISVSLAMQQSLSLYSPLSAVCAVVLPMPVMLPPAHCAVTPSLLAPGSCTFIELSGALRTTAWPPLAFDSHQSHSIQLRSGSPRRVISRTPVYTLVLKKLDSVKPHLDVLGGLLLFSRTSLSTLRNRTEKEPRPSTASNPHRELLGHNLVTSLMPCVHIQPHFWLGEDTRSDAGLIEKLLTVNRSRTLDGKVFVLDIDSPFENSGSIDVDHTWQGSDPNDPLTCPILVDSPRNRNGHRQQRVYRDALSSYICTPAAFSHHPCENSRMAVFQVAPALLLRQSSLSCYSDNNSSVTSLAQSYAMSSDHINQHLCSGAVSKDLSRSQPHSGHETLRPSSGAKPASKAEFSSKQLRPLLPTHSAGVTAPLPSSIGPFAVTKHSDRTPKFARSIVSNQSKAKSSARRHISCTQTYRHHTEGDPTAAVREISLSLFPLVYRHRWLVESVHGDAHIHKLNARLALHLGGKALHPKYRSIHKTLRILEIDIQYDHRKPNSCNIILRAFLETHPYLVSNVFN